MLGEMGLDAATAMAMSDIEAVGGRVLGRYSADGDVKDRCLPVHSARSSRGASPRVTSDGDEREDSHPGGIGKRWPRGKEELQAAIKGCVFGANCCARRCAAGFDLT